MNCDIIIPIWNELAHTKNCLESIKRNTKIPYRLILIDNASDDRTKDFLRRLAGSMEGVKLIRNEQNLGFIKAVNQGLKLSDAPYVCIMNNDTLAAESWLSEMITLAQSHKDIGMVNPQSESPGDLSVDEYAGKLRTKTGRFIETNQCLGFCMLVKREVIEKIGVLDEIYGIGGFDDTDFSIRAHKAGYKCVSACGAYVYHDWHTSFKKAGTRQELVIKNEKIFFDRWGRFLRIAYPVLRGSRQHLISDMYTSLGLAREWNWVHTWVNTDAETKKTLDSISLPAHQSMRLFYLAGGKKLFFISVLFKLVERSLKKKKHFDAIFVSDFKLFKMLSAFKWLFRAPLFYIAKDAPAIEIKDELSWTRRAVFILDTIKKPITF